MCTNLQVTNYWPADRVRNEQVLVAKMIQKLKIWEKNAPVWVLYWYCLI